MRFINNKKSKRIIAILLIVLLGLFTYNNFRATTINLGEGGYRSYGWPLEYKRVTYDDVAFLYDCDDPQYSKEYANAQASNNPIKKAILSGCNEDVHEFNTTFLAIDIAVAVIISIFILAIVYALWK